MRLLAAMVVMVSALAWSAAAAPARAPVAHAASTCNISGKERKLGATYVTSLSATGLTCSAAETLVKAFHRCRRAHGGADGKCSTVKGYRCTEKRQAIATQFDSRATCVRGKRKVTQVYTQNT